MMNRRPLIALALIGSAAVVAQREAAATSYPVPSDALVVRDCGDTREDERPMPYGQLGMRGSGAGGGGVGYGSAVGGSMAKTTSVPPAPPSPASPASAPRPVAEAAADSAAVPARTRASQEVAGAKREEAKERSSADSEGLMGAALHDEDRDSRWAPPPVMSPAQARVEWGGTIHLSNDDSGSVASAQRMLWALERGANVALGQIRTHELLNWFGFDMTPPSSGDTFGVRSSAERVDHDTFAVSLAVQGAAPPRPPMDLTVLVDRSGSMSAEGRMTYVQRALNQASGQLRRGDRVDLVLFDHEVCTPIENFVVGRDDPAVLRRAVDAMSPRGSTDLDLGLREAYKLATRHASMSGRSHRVIALTDAILNTGEVRPDVVTEVAKAFDQYGVRLTGVGVGTDFRDDVLDQLTEKGKGSYVFLGDERAVDRLFGRGFDSLVHSIADDVRFALQLPASLGLEKFYGEEASRNPEDVQPISFLAGNHQVFFQDLAIRDGRLTPTDVLTFDASWNDPITGRRTGTSWSFTVGQLLGTDTHNVRKARALVAFADVVKAQAMGQDGCAAPLDAWLSSRDAVSGDAEIAYVDGLLGKRCDVRRTPVTYAPPRPPVQVASTKVKVDADTDISEVVLACPGGVQRSALPMGTSVASFSTLPGSCDLTLHGIVPLDARVEVPPMGRDLRCVVRGGRVQCL